MPSPVVTTETWHRRRLLASAPLPVAVLDDAERLACLRLIRSRKRRAGHLSRADQSLRRRRGGARGSTGAVAARRPAAADPDLPARPGRGRACRAPPRSAPRRCSPSSPAIRRCWPQLDAPPPLLYVKGRHRASQPADDRHRRLAQCLGRRAEARPRPSPPDSVAPASWSPRGWPAASTPPPMQAAMATGTVAVLAGGIDIIYPPEHAALQRADRRATAASSARCRRASSRAARTFRAATASSRAFAAAC